MKNLIRLIKYARPYWGLLIISGIGLLGITAMNLISPWLVKELISILTSGLNDASMAHVRNITVILAAAYCNPDESDQDVQQAIAGAERVFEVLDTEPDIEDSRDAVEIQHARGEITFNEVFFYYNQSNPVLQGISFTAQPGQMVALVGPTGVGKTTTISLIARFYDPVSGSVLLDGIDLRQMTLSSLRNQISIVLQDVFLFNGNIADNIAYGSKSA